MEKKESDFVTTKNNAIPISKFNVKKRKFPLKGLNIGKEERKSWSGSTVIWLNFGSYFPDKSAVYVDRNSLKIRLRCAAIAK